MDKAIVYAKAAQVQPFYIEPAKVRRLTAYHIALYDRMKPPVIHQIQLLLLRTDGRILVRVLPDDRVMVTKVEVMVLDPERAGEIAEGGEKRPGTKAIGGSTSPARRGRAITVMTWDLAGNVTKFAL